MESQTHIGSSQPLPVSVLTGSLGSVRATVLHSPIRQPAPGRTPVLFKEQLAEAGAR